MGAVRYTRHAKRTSSVVAVGTPVVALAFLIAAMVLPAAAPARANASAPRLVVHTHLTELIPGKSLAALLTYSTSEPAAVSAVLTPAGAMTVDRPTARQPHTRSTDPSARTKTSDRRSHRERSPRETGRPSGAPQAPQADAITLSGVDGEVYWNGAGPHGNCALAGVYTVRVIATDAAGNSSAPQFFTVTVVAAE